jgi:hypothetical protein
MVCNIPKRLVPLLLALALATSVAGCYSPTLPLPPPARDGLNVSSPDENGFVIVEGLPGVMDPGEQAVIVNIRTYYGWIVPVDDDGGFQAIVIADIGDVLSIQRRIGDEVSQSIDAIVPGPDE